jgi:hypothetical protein
MMKREKKYRPIQRFIAILTILVIGFSFRAYAQMPYNKYCNARFNFCVKYPVTFGMGPSPVNNDGREFYDRDGFFMTASGMYNVLENSLKDEMRSQEKDFDTITHRRQKITGLCCQDTVEKIYCISKLI